MCLELDGRLSDWLCDSFYVTIVMGEERKKWATENAIRKIKNKDKSKKTLCNFVLLLLKNTSTLERMQKVDKPERSSILKMGSAIVGWKWRVYKNMTVNSQEHALLPPKFERVYYGKCALQWCKYCWMGGYPTDYVTVSSSMMRKKNTKETEKKLGFGVNQR